MALTIDDVRRAARLARLDLDEARAATLVGELNGILMHMAALQGTATDGHPEVVGVGATGTPLREDTRGDADPLTRRPEDFAPEMREGFFIVPRLATHESADASGEGA